MPVKCSGSPPNRWPRKEESKRQNPQATRPARNAGGEKDASGSTGSRRAPNAASQLWLAAPRIRATDEPMARREMCCMLRLMRRFFFVLSLLGAIASGMQAIAAEPPAEPRFELFSRGPDGSAVLISKTHLDAIRLEKPVVISDNLTVTHAGVGYFEKDGKSGPLMFRPASEVPHKKGLGFGWVLKVDSSESQIQVEEQFVLPKKNGTWTVDPDTTRISDDGLTATTTEVHTFWDFLWRVWTLEEGDPDGPHSFAIKVAGKPVADLKFKILKK